MTLPSKNLAAPPPPWLYAFEADAERAAWLDQRMRSRLADSLEHIFEQGQEFFGEMQSGFEDFLIQLRANPISPLAFSFYCDIVLALEKDEVEDTANLLKNLIALPPHPGGPIIQDIGDRKQDAISDRIARFVDTDPETPFEIFPPSPKAAATCRAQIKEAFALMDAGDPALAAELRTLLREITLAQGHQDKTTMTFDGASSFMLWGGIIINADRDDGALEMVQMLAHESAHNLLFGFCVDEPVLENGFDGRYPSPLRKDLRPLEGIYHATFVVARMYRAVKQLLNSGVLTSDQVEKAEKDLTHHARLFQSGIETVQQHGMLTATGAGIIEGAIAYMEVS